MACAIVANSAFWKVRSVSGSSPSANEVKPVRSANTTVTCLRSASWLASLGAGGGGRGGGDGGLTAAARAVPQRGQNANSKSHSNPHDAQEQASRRPQRW